MAPNAALQPDRPSFSLPSSGQPVGLAASLRLQGAACELGRYADTHAYD